MLNGTPEIIELEQNLAARRTGQCQCLAAMGKLISTSPLSRLDHRFHRPNELVKPGANLVAYAIGEEQCPHPSEEASPFLPPKFLDVSNSPSQPKSTPDLSQ